MRDASVVAQIAELEPGESYAKVQRVPKDGIIVSTDIEGRTYKMRNALASAVARAQRQNGATYTVENGVFFSRANALLMTVVVTRLT